MPSIIKEKDKPTSIAFDEANAEMPYVILDVNGNKRARFAESATAEAFIAEINAPEPALMQEDMDGTDVAHDQEDREQQEDNDMPRGIPNKRKAQIKDKVRKTVKKAVKKRAAAAKESVKKVMKRRKAARGK
jgi:hypothetical protein